MTSRNSSSTEPNRSLQRQITKRRLWLIAAVWIYMIMYYPVAVVMLIARSEASMAAHTQPQIVLDQKLSEVSGWIGLRQEYLWIIVLIGAVTAIQGYAYLFSKEKLDFYESQPVGRMQRFWAIFWNGVLIFMVPLVVCTFLSILAAAAMNAMTKLVFLEAVISLVRTALIFFGSYAAGILAVMLTGHLIVSCLMAMFLLVTDSIIGTLLPSLAATFFTTWPINNENMLDTMISPLYNALAVQRLMNTDYSGWAYRAVTRTFLSQILYRVRWTDLVMLLVCVITLIIAVSLYKNRKAEYAGRAVIHAPVRFLVRLILGATTGLFAGQFILSVFGRTDGTAGDVAVIFSILVAAVLSSGIVEIIFFFDMRKFFKNTWQIVLSGILAVFVFSIFRYDLTGYDSYLPDSKDVSTCAVAASNEIDPGYYPDPMDGSIDLYDSSRYASRAMFLTDIEGVEKLAGDAMAYTRSTSLKDIQGWQVSFTFRLKSGRTVKRSAYVPYTEDAAVLDRVTGTEEYRKGVFALYDDSFVRSIEEMGKMECSNGAQTRYGDGTLYDGFAEAYRKDLETYNFSFASTHDVILEVGFSIPETPEYPDLYISESYPVYESFTETIRYLKDNGLYLAPVEASEISRIVVSRYDMDDGTDHEAAFTDRQEIKKIMDASSVSSVFDAWKRSDYYDWNLDAAAVLKDTGDRLSLYIKSSEVPAFVTKALE